MAKKIEKITECCPHCENEVELDEKFERQHCPVCGAMIAPCNMCDHDTCDCANCELDKGFEGTDCIKNPDFDYYTINVMGGNGYSFMVAVPCGAYEKEDIESVAERHNLFQEPNDVETAMVDDLVGWQDVEHFEKIGQLYVFNWDEDGFKMVLTNNK